MHCASDKSVTGKLNKDRISNSVRTFYVNLRPRTDLRGICLIHGNTFAYKSNIVKQFLRDQ